MMERLMEDGFRYGEPVYTQCSEKMIALSEELRKQLDQETAALLDKLEEVFVKRETASVEGAFREGSGWPFCWLWTFSHLPDRPNLELYTISYDGLGESPGAFLRFKEELP